MIGTKTNDRRVQHIPVKTVAQSACAVGCIIPSYSLFSGIFGASPFGVLLAPFYIRTAPLPIILFCSYVCLISLFSLTDIRDIFQTFIILTPVLIFLFFSQISDLCKLNGVLNLLIVIFLMEAFLEVSST